MSKFDTEGDASDAAKTAFLRILAQHPELTIDELAALRARHGDSFGAITLAEIRANRPRKRDLPRRGAKLVRVPGGLKNTPVRRVLRLLRSRSDWMDAAAIAEALELATDQVEAAVAELVRRNQIQTGFDGAWRYRG